MLFTSIDRVASEDISVTSMFLRVAAPYLRSWGPVTLRVVPWAGWTQLSLVDSDPFGAMVLLRVPADNLVRVDHWGWVAAVLCVLWGFMLTFLYLPAQGEPHAFDTGPGLLAPEISPRCPGFPTRILFGAR